MKTRPDTEFRGSRGTILRAWLLLIGVLALLPLQPGALRADEEAGNWPHVVAGQWGRCYARSIPQDHYGPLGLTKLFRVSGQAEGDVKLASYPFFTQRLYLACNVAGKPGQRGPALVQLGPWARGHKPDAETLAIAFHYDGREVRRYSTLDISGGQMERVSCSVSHYDVFGPIEGFRRLHEDRTLFVLTTVDGRELQFDVASGALVQSTPGGPAEPRGACYWPDSE